MTRTVTALILLALLAPHGLADEPDAEARKWERAYVKLLAERPEIRAKVERGDATKGDVIAWMKAGGDGKQQKDRYYGWKPAASDPAGFETLRAERVFSGPQPGEKLPAFEVIDVLDKEGRRFDPVAGAGEKPLVLIFADQSGTSKKGLYLFGAVVETIAGRSKSGLATSVVFLGDDPFAVGAEDLAGLRKATSAYRFGSSREGREGPGIYGLNRNVGMTIVIARKGRVLHNFAFPVPMLYPDPHVVGALAEVVGEERETVVGWLADE